MNLQSSTQNIAGMAKLRWIRKILILSRTKEADRERVASHQAEEDAYEAASGVEEDAVSETEG